MTDGDCGFTLKDYTKFEEIFNRDLERGGSFVDG
jgi:hypothetical protein